MRDECDGDCANTCFLFNLDLICRVLRHTCKQILSLSIQFTPATITLEAVAITTATRTEMASVVPAW